MKLFTIILSFSDHLKGVGQFEADSPTDALKLFVQKSESLNGYDRIGIEKAIRGPIHSADIKGIWSFIFDFNSNSLAGVNNNPILGADVIQTDYESPAGKVRKGK